MTKWKFRMYVKATFFSFSLFHTVFVSGCSSTKEWDCEMLSGTSVVDGGADEWKGKSMLDLKDNGLLVGIQNDATNVFVCLMSTRTAVRLMTTTGKIVGIEPEYGKKFGIPYETGMDNTLSMNIESGKIEKPTGGRHQGGNTGGCGRRRHNDSLPRSDRPTEGGSMASNDELRSGGVKNSYNPNSLNL